MAAFNRRREFNACLRGESEDLDGAGLPVRVSMTVSTCRAPWSNLVIGSGQLMGGC